MVLKRRIVLELQMCGAMVSKIKHAVKGNVYNCELCGFVYAKVTHARNCESFCKKNGRFSLENIPKAIARMNMAVPA